MRIVEIGLGIFMLLGIAMNLLLYPGGQFFTLIACTLLSLEYFFLGFVLFNDRRLRDLPKEETFKNVTGLRIVLAAITGTVLSCLLIGVLFKMNFYPGAGPMLILGVGPTLLLFFISLIGRFRNIANLKTAISRTGFWSIIGLILLFTPWEKHLEFQYSNHPEYIEAAKNAKNNPDNLELQEKMEAERKRIN